MLGTWIGVVVGLGLLLLMAFSGFVLDLEDKMEDRRQRKTAKHEANTVTYQQKAAV